ncbi:hypothetical protein [Aestuariibius sp. HNIBRBA575]|uniref:hypothetical protein n=1 Tax=Aestuariibius sp. HNIBRBA575 TaxID=3233343 RepID=UPI0034A201BF
MMLYDAEDSVGLDIDWFAVDTEGKIAHFATGGVGFLPAETGKDLQAADAAFDVLFAANETTSTIIIEENLPIFSSDEKRSQYITAFENMAKRGYFSYDVADPSVQNSHYVLVAAPIKPALLAASACDEAQRATVPFFCSGVFDKDRLRVVANDWLANT